MVVIRTGPLGGKYVFLKGKVVYLSSMSPEKRKQIKRSSNKTKKNSKNKFGAS